MRDFSWLLPCNEATTFCQEVMVVTKKEKKRRPLSAVVDSASRERIRRSPYKVCLSSAGVYDVAHTVV